MESSVTSCTTTIAAPTRKRQVTNTSDPNVPIGYKQCPHCGKILPVSEFTKNKGNKDGLNRWCKNCDNEAQRTYYAKRQSVPKKEKNTVKITEVPDGYKICRCCGKLKPLSEFGKDRQFADGHDTKCKECRNARRREIAAAKRTKRRAEKEAATQPKVPFDYDRRMKRAYALSFAPDTKECNQCHVVKPMTEFQTCSSNVDHIANTCKQCMSENRKRKNEQKKAKADKQKEETTMKQQTTAVRNNTQTFEYLAIGTKLYYIHNNVALEAPIRNINIDIATSGALISYIVPTDKPTEEHKIYANEIGSTVFTNPLDLVTYFFQKQDMKYNSIKK